MLRALAGSRYFVNDGVLLREPSNDFALTKYSAIIIGETHERNVNTDVLVSVLSGMLKMRRDMTTEKLDKYKPLKLIIMLATLHVSGFTENKTSLDTPPPVLKVDAISCVSAFQLKECIVLPQ